MLLSRSLIVTGMNMAGKSTFLKTLLVNQLFASSLGYVFAESFSTDSFFLCSSLKIRDELTKGKSKYFLEAERLLAVQQLVKKRKVLCAVDEILNGTNTSDRITASIGILKNLSAYPESIIAAATHDIEIAHVCSNYDAFYFDGTVSNEKIIFDYTIKKGIVPKRNALAILQFLGLLLKKEENT